MAKEKIEIVDLSDCVELPLLEQAFYKDQAATALVAFMLASDYSTDSDAYKKYYDDYVEAHTAMTILRTKLFDAYVPDELKERAYHFEYDFSNKAIKLKVK